MLTLTPTSTPTQFQNALNQLRDKIWLPSEFAQYVYSGELQSSFSDNGRLSGDVLECEAFSLGKEELENCLITLVRNNSSEIKALMLKIIELRMSSRLVRLIWALTQYYYTVSEMRKAAMLAANSEYCCEEMLKELFSREQEYIEYGAKIIGDHNGVISDVIEHYNIIVDSPLTDAVLRRYFQKADEWAFMHNQKYVADVLDKGNEADNLPVVCNYLAQPWTKDSSKQINMKLLKRFGMPEEGKSAMWENIPRKLIAQYRKLIFLNIMEDYFGQESRKYLIFNKYRDTIKSIRTYQKGEAIAINFGHFGILDTCHMNDYSLLLEKATLDITLENLERQDQEAGPPANSASSLGTDNDIKAFQWTPQKTDIHARDVIIEEKSSDVLVLGMSGLGKLYTEELMIELLRKGEELWPVKFKQAIARFKAKQ